MKIHLSRWLCLDAADNLERMQAEARDAVARGCRIVVFPELFLTGYRRQVDVAEVRARCARISEAAPGVLLVSGTLSEEGRNRALAWCDGRQVAAYDKVHLFRPNDEHLLWTPGDRYVAFTWSGLRIGLAICNDIRFPEQARLLRLETRCTLLLAVAWWPWRRDHIWRALLQARAAENALWVAGCCIAGSAWPEERFAGAGNYVFDPRGEQVMTADDQTYELALDQTPEAVVDPLLSPRAPSRVVLVDEPA